MLGLAVAGIAVIGWSVVQAQTLSGTSIIFGSSAASADAESGRSSGGGASEDAGIRFFNVPRSSSSLSPSSSSVAVPVPEEDGSAPFPAGINLRVDDFPQPNQAVDIPLESYSWSAEQSSGRNRASLGDFRIVMKQNLASPRLFLAAANGDRLPRAMITVRRNGMAQEYLRWTLSDVTVSSFQTVSTPAEALPTDTLTLDYGRIEFQVTPVLQNGTAGASIRNGWDVLAEQEL